MRHQKPLRLLTVLAALLLSVGCSSQKFENQADNNVNTPSEPTQPSEGNGDDDVATGGGNGSGSSGGGTGSGSSGGSGSGTGGSTGSGSEGDGTLTESLKVIAPGGSGAITAVAEDPSNSQLILVGTELNGIFRSIDGGKSFQNISHDLNTRRVLDVKIVSASGTTHAYLATDGGIWHSDSSSGTLGDHWEERNNGFESHCLDSSSTCSSRYSHPIQTLTIDPNNHDILYAGIGETMLGNTVSTYRLDASEPRVYKTTDGGKNWKPILYLPDVASSSGETYGGIVYSIHVDKNSSLKLSVATDMGLYISYNSGGRFYRVGASTVYTTSDKGVSWNSCVGNKACNTNLQASAVCTEKATSSACLPVNEENNEPYPNLRYAYWENGILYALTVDTGWAGGTKTSMDTKYRAACDTDSSGNYVDCLSLCSTSDTVQDSKSDFFRGGPWSSSNNGLSWTYLNPNNTTITTTTPQVRCSADDSLEKNTNYTFMAVNPNDVNHFVLGASFVRGHTSGIYEVNSGNWVHLREACKDISSCYEGGKISALWSIESSVAMPGIFGLTVSDWTDLRIYSAHIMGLWKIGRQGSSYKIDHLDQNQSSTDSNYWSSTGIDLHCPHAGVAHLGTNLFVGAIDVGVLKSTDEGTSWKRVTEDNPDLVDLGLHLDNTSVMIDDDQLGVLYANNYWNGGAYDDTNTMMVSSTDGETWTPIGGQLYNGECSKSSSLTCEANGLPKAFEPLSLAFDQTRESSRRLIAGGKTSDTQAYGVYVYDPLLKDTSTSNQWNPLTGDGCSVFKEATGKNIEVHQVLNAPDNSNFIFAAVTDKDNTDGLKSKLTSKEGVYAIKISSTGYTCSRVLSSGDDAYPMAVKAIGVAQGSDGSTKLLAAGENEYWPAVWTTTFDFNNPSASNWEVALDFNTNLLTDASQEWWSYLSNYPDWQDEYSYTYANRKEFSSLVTDPSNPQRVLATMWDNPGTDGHAAMHVYSSEDGGLTFGIAEEFEELPVKTLRKIQFGKDEKYLYLSGKCTSLYRMPNPY